MRQQLVNVGKGSPSGKAYSSSRFSLPGGNAEDVRRVFKATFGLDLPKFDQRVGHLCRINS